MLMVLSPQITHCSTIHGPITHRSTTHGPITRSSPRHRSTTPRSTTHGPITHRSTTHRSTAHRAATHGPITHSSPRHRSTIHRLILLHAPRRLSGFAIRHRQIGDGSLKSGISSARDCARKVQRRPLAHVPRVTPLNIHCIVITTAEICS